MARYHTDLSGNRFTRLVAKRYVGGSKWECLCDCGSAVVVLTEHLKSGHTRSCGCLLVEKKTTHGRSRSHNYRAWVEMRARCNNPSNPAYGNYGGRGIRVCERWSDYSAFRADMGEQPAPRMQIDRIDNDGHYEPGNCRWATQKKNLNNKRTNRFVEFEGRRQTIAQWAEEIGINYRTLNNRINRGWTVERALTTPAGKDA